MFTDRDVRNGNKVCVIGATLETRAVPGRIAASARNSASRTCRFRVIGVLSRKGANMMGMDQDDVLLLPWTTIKYRVSGTSCDDPGLAPRPARRARSTR